MTALVTDNVSELLQKTWLISSDSHIIEFPSLFEGRMPKHLEERGPRVESEETGDFWYVDGYKLSSFSGVEAGSRFFKKTDEMRLAARFEDVPVSAYDPREYIDLNEGDGVWGSVIYPTLGLTLFYVPNTEIVTATMKAYNDWLAEFCGEDNTRLKGIAMVNVDDPDDGADELRRCREMGLAGAMITVSPPPWAPFRAEGIYDRFWAAAQDLDMPISLHCSTERGDPLVGAPAFELYQKGVDPNWLLNRDVMVRSALADLIYTGVFERFPGLKVGSVENELGWLAFFLDQLDYQYTQRANRFGDRFRIKNPDAMPSQFWASNCFASFQEDAHGMRMRDVIGVDTMVWGSDYPHPESTWPRTREILGDVLADTPVDQVTKIVSANSCRLYGFRPPADGRQS